MFLKSTTFLEKRNNQKQHEEQTCVPVVFLSPSDSISVVFSENVLRAHFNRMRDWCETMETNQTKTLLAESLGYNYSAASTFSIQLFSLPFLFLSSLPLRNVATRCPYFTIAHLTVLKRAQSLKLPDELHTFSNCLLFAQGTDLKCARFLSFPLCQIKTLTGQLLHISAINENIVYSTFSSGLG